MSFKRLTHGRKQWPARRGKLGGRAAVFISLPACPKCAGRNLGPFAAGRTATKPGCSERLPGLRAKGFVVAEFPEFGKEGRGRVLAFPCSGKFLGEVGNGGRKNFWPTCTNQRNAFAAWSHSRTGPVGLCGASGMRNQQKSSGGFPLLLALAAISDELAARACRATSTRPAIAVGELERRNSPCEPCWFLVRPLRRIRQLASRRLMTSRANAWPIIHLGGPAASHERGERGQALFPHILGSTSLDRLTLAQLHQRRQRPDAGFFWHDGSAA